jgi:hypothetical protein
MVKHPHGVFVCLLAYSTIFKKDGIDIRLFKLKLERGFEMGGTNIRHRCVDYYYGAPRCPCTLYFKNRINSSKCVRKNCNSRTHKSP